MNFPSHHGLLATWVNNQGKVKTLARYVIKYMYGSNRYGQLPFPAWDKQISTAGLFATSSKSLAKGRKHVALSSILPWSAYASVGGHGFKKGPAKSSFLQPCGYKEFVLLALELLAYEAGHTDYLRY